MIIRLFILFFFFWIMGAAAFVSLITKQTNGDHAHDTPVTAIVFTGAKDRIASGIAMLEENKASHLFITGIGADVSFENFIDQHIPASSGSPRKIAAWKQKITLGNQARSTIGNAAEVAKWAKDEDAMLSDHIILITSNYHMPRALLMLRSVLPNSHITTSAVINERFSDGSWWKDPHSLWLIFKEYHKYLVSWLTFDVMNETPSLDAQ